MSEVLILEFSGVSEDQYNAVHKHLGLDPETGEGDWPPGLRSHTGAASPDGDLVVVEIWDSQDEQAAFMASRLGPALGDVGVPDPKRVEWLRTLSTHSH